MNYRRLFRLDGGARRAEADLDTELAHHLAMREEELRARGMSSEAAYAEARRRFGDFDRARQRLRAGARERATSMALRETLASVWADARYALRQARRAPAFFALAVASLGIGIGATTTVFALVEHVLLRPLPYPQSDRLVAITGMDSTHNTVPTVSSTDWKDWRRASALDGAALYGFGFRQPVVTADSAFRVDAEGVSPNFFAVLRPRFAAGRGFPDARDATGTVVISERLWRALFSADPALSAPLRTPSGALTIAGVVADGQEFPAATDVWFPARFADGARTNVNWYMIGRLRDGVSTTQAAAELSGIARGILGADHAARYDYGVGVETLAGSLVGNIAEYLVLLLAVVVTVLLIVCANVSASSLARALARSREMAIRTSLGAGRARLLRQSATEHVVLGLAGGVLGLVVAGATLRVLLARFGADIPRAGEVHIDARVFAFLFVLSALAGLAAGIAPAWQLSRVSLRAMLASGGRTAARARGAAGGSLVVAQVALALLLLVGASLLVRSFRAVLGRDIGFDTNVATAEITLPFTTYGTDSTRRMAYWERMVGEYAAIPGVEAVGVTNWVPLGLTGSGFIDVEGKDYPDAGAVYRTVSRGFFSAMGIPLLRGRTFDTSDLPEGERVVVINRTMAERYWPGSDPIGQRVRATSMEPARNGRASPWLRIVGVVGDVRTYGLETDARAEMYVDYAQTPDWTNSMVVVARGHMSAERLAPLLRARARSVDPQVAVDVGTLGSRLRDTLSTRVLALSLVSAFAIIALVVAAIGVYGVLSYGVAERTRELAVRAAVGATRVQLFALVLRAGARVTGTGVLFGVVAALWGTRLLASMLFEVSALDAWSFAMAIGALTIVALAAIVVPAYRATRLDPIIALQAE